MKMSSSKPYLVRALHAWIVDNDYTPHILVDINHPDVAVPEGYGENGTLVLNCSPRAVRNLTLADDYVSFEARFGGVGRQIYLPMFAVLAIYAQENGQGMFFDPQPVDEYLAQAGTAEEGTEPGEAASEEPPRPEPPSPGGKPSLRIVK